MLLHCSTSCQAALQRLFPAAPPWFFPLPALDILHLHLYSAAFPLGLALRITSAPAQELTAFAATLLAAWG
ncbi:hypothetical protein COCSUDRAFT_34203 [Coccomyxa subellipsoidea C-169]|uniref:Uncharacterized protein n=1 Tax=Coccomyxa subellipsoidea (strain C-169) TaxID=574566 RepID=I0YMQ1_COCSC|nr:hypothetical protein COCSUDRAFT_34203 [Coccomyxa subellipsoidea C-169]EIE19670.1 hypothetical protein COCSUDRAFT_34203 [Coccomyxa subellipsoidea C-169]|eukprot:XP_005644214.1 hypothetical protein COCSUDRAFT_34203 [Coccomyxa subellipsoidea C-169]